MGCQLCQRTYFKRKRIIEDLRDIYYSLGLKNICDSISEKYKFKYDLNEILSVLVYSRILTPGSKRASLSHAEKFLEQPKSDLHQVYRALEVLAAENTLIQAELYKNSQQVLERKKGVLYYDCTNYYFEIEEEDDFRKYGVSKEHRPNPIVQMGLFMDADGIPLSFSIFDGNQNEQPSMMPLEEKIIKDFGTFELIVCKLTDALHETFGFRTDYQITSQKNMRKILNQTKKAKK